MSKQSLPFSIATRVFAKDFAKGMNLALREQVAQSFLTLGTSLDFSYRQGSNHDGVRPHSHFYRKGSRELDKPGCDGNVAGVRCSISRCGRGKIPVRRRHHEGFSTAAQVSVAERKSGGDAFALSALPVDPQRHPVWIAGRENRNARATYCSPI